VRRSRQRRTRALDPGPLRSAGPAGPVVRHGRLPARGLQRLELGCGRRQSIRHGDRARERQHSSREVCICGRAGALADREPVYAGDGEWGLACPACGRLDRLEWLTADARRALLADAAQRARTTEADWSDRAA
jgi:hypothetical protein